MRSGSFIISILTMVLVVAGCSTMPQRPEARGLLFAEVSEAIAIFKTRDPGMEQFFKNSYGYVVLPKVAKGAFILGGAYGRGIAFERGRKAGYCDVSQASLGFSFGGEYFREIIFFKTATDFNKFKTGQFTLSAQATGVAVVAGAAAKADYKSGVAVFVMADRGLMVDVSLGGQKFNYVAMYPVK